MHPDDDNAITTEEKIWDLTQNINVKGVWFGCKYGILAMKKVRTYFDLKSWVSYTDVSHIEQARSFQGPRYRRFYHQRRFLRRHHGCCHPPTCLYASSFFLFP